MECHNKVYNKMYHKIRKRQLLKGYNDFTVTRNTF